MSHIVGLLDQRASFCWPCLCVVSCHDKTAAIVWLDCKLSNPKGPVCASNGSASDISKRGGYTNTAGSLVSHRGDLQHVYQAAAKANLRDAAGCWLFE